MTLRILTVGITYEHDVVAARQRARQIAVMLGFGVQDQTRIATAVSELARNAFVYARGGKVEFVLEGVSPPQILTIHVTDQGGGIKDLDLILAGSYRSPTGMGVGLLGASRLLDQFDIRSQPGNGTHITLKKLLPSGTKLISAKDLGNLMAQLTALPANISLLEVQAQNQELLSTLAELKARQEELLQLTRELEDTNRGVVALYAELDEKANHLRRADEMKSRFLSNMSHEFRTPLSSIRALSKLLLDETDGPLTEEQEKQVSFIRQGAEGLSELVNDLLDLAKIEAGKTEVRIAEFDVNDMFGALRGMLRPLLLTESISLQFSVQGSIPLMSTDEAKVSQVLRNFISNALKFTERGYVHVSAALSDDGRSVKFSVRDTGLGIDLDSQALIFEEFSQVQNHLQKEVKGTGLGLPLCRKLVSLLGGAIELESTPGQGSTFTAIIPLNYAGELAVQSPPLTLDPAPEGSLPVLIIEDQQETQLLYEKFLRHSSFHPILTKNLREADAVLKEIKPAAIVLDIILNGQHAWHWLATLKSNPALATVPVILATEIDDSRKGTALGADAFFLKPMFREALLATLVRLTGLHQDSLDEDLKQAQSTDALNFAAELAPHTSMTGLSTPRDLNHRE